MQHLCDAATSNGEQQAVSLRLLPDIIGEMNTATASSLSLPLTYHERCRQPFVEHEHALLRRVCVAAVTALLARQPSERSHISEGATLRAGYRTSAGPDACPVSPPQNACACHSDRRACAHGRNEHSSFVGCHADALALLSTVLAWEFRDQLGYLTIAAAFGGGAASGFARTHGATLSSAPPALHLPESWLEVVFAPELLQWLLAALQCAATAQDGNGGGGGAALAAGARGVLMQMCSVRGKAVHANEGAARARAAFCVHGILAVRTHILFNPSASIGLTW